MRCYLVDELQPEVIASLEAQLTKRGCQSGIERLYWLPLEKERLLPVQREHESSCGPHCLALEILDDAVRLEFLVRAKGRMRCECVCYLSPEAERHMMDWLDAALWKRKSNKGSSNSKRAVVHFLVHSGPAKRPPHISVGRPFHKQAFRKRLEQDLDLLFVLILTATDRPDDPSPLVHGLKTAHRLFRDFAGHNKDITDACN